MVQKRQRIVRLEACRGIAACVVVAHHLVRTFAPDVGDRLNGTVAFVAINGSAAVAFFFVLSGYVLSVRFFEAPAPSYMAVAAIKRLPRLALLTTIVAIASALLWISGLYRDASALFDLDFKPSLFGAVKEGAWRTFMAGDFNYDSSLWTMVHEFRGSLLVFVMAPFLVMVLNRKMIWFAFPFAIVLFHYADPFMIFFVCGMAVAYYQRHLGRIVWHASLTAILIAVALFLLSYPPAAGDQPASIISAWAVGASLLIVGILQSHAAERLLDNRIGAALGFLSFPIYLTHVPVLAAAGTLIHAVTGNAVLAATCTVAITGVVSWPLALVDARWVRFLNSRTSSLFSNEPSEFTSARLPRSAQLP
jgi:peptidoglycan/LPS O-acetylase OafA/YrhL